MGGHAEHVRMCPRMVGGAPAGRGGSRCVAARPSSRRPVGGACPLLARPTCRSAGVVRRGREHAARTAGRARPRGARVGTRRSTRPAPHVCAGADQDPGGHLRGATVCSGERVPPGQPNGSSAGCGGAGEGAGDTGSDGRSAGVSADPGRRVRGAGGRAGRRPSGHVRGGGAPSPRDPPPRRGGGGSGTQQSAGGGQESTIPTILTLTLMFLLWRGAAGAAERNNQPGLGRGRGRGRA